MKELSQSHPLVFGSPMASRVAPGAERGPMPYLFFSGLLSPLFGLRPGLPGSAGNSEYSEVIFRWLALRGRARHGRG